MDWSIINKEEEYNYSFLEFLKDKEFIEHKERCYNNSKLARIVFIERYFGEYQDYCIVNGFIYQSIEEIKNLKQEGFLC